MPWTKFLLKVQLTVDTYGRPANRNLHEDIVLSLWSIRLDLVRSPSWSCPPNTLRRGIVKLSLVILPRCRITRLNMIGMLEMLADYSSESSAQEIAIAVISIQDADVIYKPAAELTMDFSQLESA